MKEPSFEELRAAIAATYTLEREIGRGGMATVYLAMDKKHKRQVALKLLRTAVMENGGVERFLREIRLTARLSHPHILPLLDSGELLGAPFFVMPFIPGETLSERLDRDTRLPQEDAVRLTLEIADALAYAHAQGVIHRDIKPANILLTGRHAVVADFGVAKALTSSVTEDEQTQIGLTVGTIAYMSPEQALGEPYVDNRTDIFSLGAVLYEMLAGEKAFLGANAQAVLARRFAGGPPSVRDKRPEVSEDIDRIIARSLSVSPDDRFASAGEFEEALIAATRIPLSNVSATQPAITVEVTPSLAVLPFDNLSGDPDNEYLSDGITEEILTLLSRRRTIRVCARASAFSFKKNHDDVRLIGSRLGVLNVLLGSVRRATDRLRVTARLVDARDGFQIWSERYDRQLEDVFAIQDEIGASIAGALNATLVGADMAPAETPKPRIDVYDTFLRGRALWNQRTGDSARRAIKCFEEVIAAEPSYAAAHAALADAWVTLGVYGAAEPREAMAAARRAAETALGLDGSLAESRTALAFVLAAHDWDWDGADRSFRQAIALNPQLPAPHQGLATMCHTPRARFDQAVGEIQQALEMDPLSPVLHATLASVLLYARRYEDAVTAGRAALALDAKFAPAHFFLCQAHESLRQNTYAREHGELAVTTSGSSSETLAAFGHVLCTTGDIDQARTIQASLEERARTEYVAGTHLAQIPMALGDNAAAMRHLERAFSTRASDLAWIGVRPSYDQLRGVAEFEEIMRRLGLRSMSNQETIVAGL